MTEPDPEIEREAEFETIQRALVVGWELAIGRTLTSTMLMRRFGIDRTTALRLLELASLSLPIVSVELSVPGGLLEWRRQI